MFFNYPKESNHMKFDISNQNTLDQSKTKRRTRTPFTKDEDQQLLQLVKYFGIKDKNNWYFISSHIKGRTPRQCRERYQLFLADDVRKKAKWTKEEDDLLISKYKIVGPHWKQMEQYFVGRTSYNIKNRFISLNRRFNFANGNQTTISFVESPVIPNNNNNNADPEKANFEKNDQNETNTSFFSEYDFDFDDVFPLFDGNENFNLFE